MSCVVFSMKSASMSRNVGSRKALGVDEPRDEELPASPAESSPPRISSRARVIASRRALGLSGSASSSIEYDGKFKRTTLSQARNLCTSLQVYTAGKAEMLA